MSKQETRNTATIPKRNTVTPSDIQWGLERAVKTGLRIVEPKANELQLDIDSIGLLTFHEMQWSILEKGGITKYWRKKVRESKRGNGHLHVTVTLPCSLETWIITFGGHYKRLVEAIARVALQVLLGSDPKREAFNLCRVLRGNKYPIVFFEKENNAKNRRSK